MNSTATMNALPHVVVKVGRVMRAEETVGNGDGVILKLLPLVRINILNLKGIKGHFCQKYIFSKM